MLARLLATLKDGIKPNVNSTINEMRPTIAIVSTMVRPNCRRPLIDSLYTFCTLLTMMLLLSTTAFAQESTPVPVTFRVSPDYARVYVVDGGIQEFQANREVFLDPSPAVRSGGRKLTVRFLVPKWGTDPDKVIQKPDSIRWDREVFIEFADLKRERQYPSDGMLELELSTTHSLSAFTYHHPVLSLAGLLALLALVLATPRLKSVLHRLTSDTPEEVQPVAGYTLTGKLGAGGMGEVWEASSTSGMACAIKFLKPELAEDPEFKKRFEREVKACIAMDHPHLLKLYGSGDSSDGRMFMISELLTGQTLKELIRNGDFDRPQLAAKLLEEIGDALHYLHQRQMVHRDVKPDNIFVCRDGSLKLMDMGLVQGESLTVLTQTGQVLGTPAYMAPEQLNNQANPASDQYSLGIIVYELLAGQRPFIQPDMVMLAYQHSHVAPQAPTELEPRIPVEVEHGILRMLEKKPEDRYPDLAEVQETLGEKLAFLSWDSGEDTVNAQLKDFTPDTTPPE